MVENQLCEVVKAMLEECDVTEDRRGIYFDLGPDSCAARLYLFELVAARPFKAVMDQKKPRPARIRAAGPYK
jgi:hypothetical protein